MTNANYSSSTNVEHLLLSTRPSLVQTALSSTTLKNVMLCNSRHILNFPAKGFREKDPKDLQV